MSSNINALLDKCEDPSKMVDQLIRNLDEDLGKVKAETASIMAEEARSKREYDECNSEVNKMLEYAKRAVASGNDEDARKFLEKKVQASERLTTLENKYNLAKENSKKMKDMHNKLEAQLSELSAKRADIKAKVATAKMQEKINKIGSSVNSATNNLGAFTRMEEKANRMLDEANAMAELNNKEDDGIDSLMKKYEGRNSSIEDELVKLKGTDMESSKIDEELAMLKQNKE
jgi:phage shock protein A